LEYKLHIPNREKAGEKAGKELRGWDNKEKKRKEKKKEKEKKGLAEYLMLGTRQTF
jgi:hypothetical protein